MPPGPKIIPKVPRSRLGASVGGFCLTTSCLRAGHRVAGSVIQIGAEVGDLAFVNRLDPRVHAIAERPEFPAQLEIL